MIQTKRQWKLHCAVSLNDHFMCVSCLAVTCTSMLMQFSVLSQFVCVDTMCLERTLCMYSPCQERTSNQELTHSMFAVSFGIRFGLITLENSGIGHKIMWVAWVCPWHWNYFSNHFNHEWKSALGQNLNSVCTSQAKSADHLNTDGSPFSVKCVKKCRSALSGEDTYWCVLQRRFPNGTLGLRLFCPLPYSCFKFIGGYSEYIFLQIAATPPSLASFIWFGSILCILIISNHEDLHKICTNVSFSATHLLHERVSAFLFLCSSIYCKLVCPVKNLPNILQCFLSSLLLNWTYLLVALPNMVGWCHTFHRLSIQSVSYFPSIFLFWTYTCLRMEK